MPEQKILIIGSSGFIASSIIAQLLKNDVQLRLLARSAHEGTRDNVEYVIADVAKMTSPSDWDALIEGVDVVINCSGILKQTYPTEFNDIHFLAPMACVAALKNHQSSAKFIQISALGEAEDGEFIASKHRFDEALLKNYVNAVVVRPSLVISTKGSYGGTSLLRALAATPYVSFLPGSGEQIIRPILLEDLARVVGGLINSDDANQEIVYAVGPKEMAISSLLNAMRSWLKIDSLIQWRVPLIIVWFATQSMDRFGNGPMGLSMYVMLNRGNTSDDESFEKMVGLAGVRPKDVLHWFLSSPSYVQDRWHARMYPITLISRFSLILIWILSGVVGFLAKPEAFLAIQNAMGLSEVSAQWLVWGTSFLDLIFGALLLMKVQIKRTLQLMLLMCIGYTVLIGVTLPELWLEPMGGLLKNMAIIPLILLQLVLEDKR